MNHLDTPQPAHRPDGYEPPRLIVLGTIAQLTAGGTVGEIDGAGYAGDVGSLTGP